jgi:rhodanese-related sulfurtransferase
MYTSLQNKILPLPDDVIVYPAHGPGSSCGKNLGPDTFSTIGDERKTNYALKPQTQEDFIKAVTEGLGDPPSYFQMNAKINKEGYSSLEDVKQKGLTPLSITGLKDKFKEDVVLLDTRPAALFSSGYIPGSIFIGLEGRFAEWAGSILPFNQRMMLVTEEGKEEETIIRLARVGFDKVEGYLKGGFETWRNSGEPVDMIIYIEADELGMDLQHDDNVEVIDVRKENEFAEGHITDAINLPLSDLKDIVQIANIDPNKNLYIHCAGGYRSTIACSLLKRQGYHNLRNVQGGWNKIKDEKRIKTEKEASVLN